jgi:hypothetical protein
LRQPAGAAAATPGNHDQKYHHQQQQQQQQQQQHRHMQCVRLLVPSGMDCTRGARGLCLLTMADMPSAPLPLPLPLALFPCRPCCQWWHPQRPQAAPGWQQRQWRCTRARQGWWPQQQPRAHAQRVWDVRGRVWAHAQRYVWGAAGEAEAQGQGVTRWRPGCQPCTSRSSRGGSRHGRGWGRGAAAAPTAAGCRRWEWQCATGARSSSGSRRR